MVYPTTDGHPSKYLSGPVSINFVDQANAAKHYTTPPPRADIFYYDILKAVWYSTDANLTKKEKKRKSPHILDSFYCVFNLSYSF